MSETVARELAAAFGQTAPASIQRCNAATCAGASDAAEQRELPDTSVLKVPLGEGEVETLANRIVELADDPAKRDELEANVRRFVEDECHWGVVARRYAEYLERFPGPRASRRKLIAMRVGLGER